MLKKRVLSFVLSLTVLLCGCSRSQLDMPKASPSPTPGVVQKLGLELTGGEPTLKVYLTDTEKIETMGIEQYLLGVLAGEMKNDWPMEALKAQAIIARTFAVKFLMDNESSKYEGADISTDITEAQAYNAEGINYRIRQAIDETRGQVITHNGDIVYTWFHSHSGGMTATAVEGLDYEGGEQPYIRAVESNESPDSPEENRTWAQAFSAQDVIEACKQVGVDVSSISDFSIYETGPSGRATVFMIDGKEVPAPAFRVAIGSEKLRSTLIDDVQVSGQVVIIAGRGYGHGVGMSQWGAYQMALSGSSASDIIHHYYQDVSIDPLWE